MVSGIVSLEVSGYKRNKGAHGLWEEGTWGQVMMFRLMEYVGLSSPSPKRSQTMLFFPNVCMIFTCSLQISHFSAAYSHHSKTSSFPDVLMSTVLLSLKLHLS